MASKNSKDSRRRLLRLGIQLVGPLLLVLVFLRMRDSRVALDALLAADVTPLLLALAVNLGVLWFKVLRWDVLLAARGLRLPRARAWTSFLATVYVGLMTPGRVGDVLRVQYLRHDIEMPYSEGMALVVLDRLFDLYVLLAFVAVGIARFSSVIAGDLAKITWLGVGLVALGPLVLFYRPLARRAVGAVYRRLPGDFSSEGFERFLAALRAQRAHHVGLALLLSLSALLLNFLQGYWLAGALGAPIGFFDICCLLAVASLLGLLPISVSGIGVRELFFSLVFPVLGYASEKGVVFGLGVFLVIYVAVAVLGVLSWHLAPPPMGEPLARLPAPESFPKDAAKPS
ncbi:lysylphosphatidylglycerol synthase transmembrane domain-containing protein [Sorangium sp. So ce128]|uniref:lysylphosphatidylglycerol synthase transmembrane domain-containing protein n=1 Tax=Sorangium sp. So ce128 TaxID=3133281 RepID=UPI003F600518